MTVADAFARRYHGRTAQPEFAGQTDEPVGQRFAAMAAIVLGEALRQTGDFAPVRPVPTKSESAVGSVNPGSLDLASSNGA